jgi:antagonist of KipI
MTVRVLDPGLYTLVVDFGRPHCRSLGVPVGGAADRTSLALGNALVGNPPDAAALEFGLVGPMLEAECDLACVVYGAPFELAGTRRDLVVGKTFTLHKGEILHVRGTPQGMRGYLCVDGGFQTKVVLGSRSSLGPVQVGERLACTAGTIHPRFCRGALAVDLEREQEQGWYFPGPYGMLRVLPGPQAGWCPRYGPTFASNLSSFPPPLFKVSRASNRMGLRLESEPLVLSGRELVSEPVCAGAVQVTRDGQCIILGVDGQTIGGYPKVAQVISADLDVVGQVRPGAEVFFIEVTPEAAEDLYREKQAELRAWVTRLRASLGGV